MATQNVDTGLPAAGVALIGVVVTAGMSGMEQVPPGEDAVKGVLVNLIEGNWSSLRRQRAERKQAHEARHGQGQGWGGLVMERASFSLGQQAPARRRTLIPSTLLRGTPRAAALRSFYMFV